MQLKAKTPLGWAVRIGLVLLAVSCVGCGALGALGALVNGDRGGSTTVATSFAQIDAAMVDTPAATDVPQPTDVPEPTHTPEPTNTPVPPTATPLPTPTPEPIVLSGSGQTVTNPQAIPQGVYRLTTNHSGQRNYALWSYGPNDEKNLLVNTVGSYQGDHLFISEGGDWFFEVDAGGDWSIMIEPLPGEADAAQGAEGSGDHVTGLFMPEGQGNVPYTFTHAGQRNFAVWLVCTGGRDLLQNEVGSVDNQAVVRFADGPCVWQVNADGAWSIRPK